MARKDLPKLVKGDVPVVQNQHPERRAERHRLGGSLPACAKSAQGPWFGACSAHGFACALPDNVMDDTAKRITHRHPNDDL